MLTAARLDWAGRIISYAAPVGFQLLNRRPRGERVGIVGSAGSGSFPEDGSVDEAPRQRSA